MSEALLALLGNAAPLESPLPTVPPDSTTRAAHLGIPLCTKAPSPPCCLCLLCLSPSFPHTQQEQLVQKRLPLERASKLSEPGCVFPEQSFQGCKGKYMEVRLRKEPGRESPNPLLPSLRRLTLIPDCSCTLPATGDPSPDYRGRLRPHSHRTRPQGRLIPPPPPEPRPSLGTASAVEPTAIRPQVILSLGMLQTQETVCRISCA